MKKAFLVGLCLSHPAFSFVFETGFRVFEWQLMDNKPMQSRWLIFYHVAVVVSCCKAVQDRWV